MRNIRRICRSCSAQVLTQVPECVRCKSLQSSVSLLQIQNTKMTQSCPSAPQSMHTPRLQPAAVMCPLSIRQNGPAYQHRHRFQTSSSKHLPTFAGIVHFEQREDSIQIRETPFSCYAQEIFLFPTTILAPFEKMTAWITMLLFKSNQNWHPMKLIIWITLKKLNCQTNREHYLLKVLSRKTWWRS